jgi:SNF2 family DNA or RNA helicase
MLEQAARDYQRTILPVVPAPAIPKKSTRKPRYCDPIHYADLPDRHVRVTTALYPHQSPAVEKLMPLRLGALFMDMGTGKTRCAIELAARRQQRVSRVIWFCPVSLKLTIAAEIEKHSAGEAVYVFDDHTIPDNISPAYWYIIGIESMSSSDRVVLAANTLIDADSFVIVDESSYIKGHASMRSMRIAEIGKRSRYRLLLTGTPLSQGVEDLYAQMRFLSPDILGYCSFYSFAHNHLEYSEKYPGMIVRAHNVPNLAEKIAPFTYQVTKAECLDLPDKLYDQVYFGLTDEQHEAYEQAKNDILLNVPDDELDSYVIFRLFTALQQVVSGFLNTDAGQEIYPHRRIETLHTVIAGIPENEKAIIWCKYIYSLKSIADAFPGSALYYGDLNEQQRAAELERFRGEARFLIATQATGGHGLTLNEAHYVVFYENEFKYSHRIQAEDRCHRIGQMQPVTYIDIVSRSGIDERIQAALSRKEDLVRAFRREVKKVKDAKTISY